MKNLHRHLIAATLLAGLGLGAIAQQAPTTPPSGGPRMMQGQPGAHDAARMERFRAMRAERMAQRLAVLKAQLKINAAQEGAWTTWTTAIQPVSRVQRPDRAEMQRLSTPERIDRMRALRTARNAEMDRRLDATKTFYASLNNEQKAVFDAVGMRFARKGGMGGGRGGHGGHG
ncbi:MAG TPA: Spy/CpxP family protein refolding chaperone, partial [Ramlibacter sp.]|nr:Spy/CpxP family protein refolding chaperone [Ramlibacter sp.]